MEGTRFFSNSDIKEWECHKVKDVAETTGKSEKDLLRLGARRKIDWWVFVNISGCCLKDVSETSKTNNLFALFGRFKLPWQSVARLVHDSKVKVSTLYTDDGREFRVMVPEKSEPQLSNLVPGSLGIGRDELYLLPDYLEELVESKNAVRGHDNQKPLTSELVEEDKGKFLGSLPKILGHLEKEHKVKMSPKTFRGKYEISGSSLRYVDEKFGFGDGGKWAFYSKYLDVWVKENPI